LTFQINITKTANERGSMCAGRGEKPYICPYPLNPGFLEEVNIKK
jgi:hypothetical protein